MQQYLITITGSKVGRAAPPQQRYVVCAETGEEALAVFNEEMPAQITPLDKVTVTACLTRVMPA